MKLLVLGFLLAVAAQSSARTWRQLQRGHFIAEGTNDVAVNILQSLNDKRQNAVFSPLGYTTILAILTEGARGNTRNQLVSSLKLPEDTYAVRSTFKRVLSELTEKEVLNKPQYKNWFYVYKNFTVQESYKNILKDNYLIDVQEIDRYNFADEEEQNKPAVETTEQPAGQNKQPSEAAENNSSEEDQSKESSEDKNSKENESKENESKEDNSSEEKPKMSKKPTNVMKIKERDDSSKTDRPATVVLNGNEKPEVATEKQQEAAETSSTPSSSTSSSSTPLGEIKNEAEFSSGQNEGVDTTARPAAAAEPEGQQTNSDLKAEESEKPLELDVRSRAKRDTTTALSANKLSTLRESSLKKISRIMSFNALFFRGNWSKRFNLCKEKQVFHVTPNDEKKVDMLFAEDEFEVGKVEDLDAWALDLPYQGERYSLLILVPAGQDGLDGLLKRLPGFTFYNIDKQLTKLRTRVTLPKLNFYSITKPKDSFIKSGITDLFSEDADLSGISETKGLFLEELVQLVTFELDESDASYNYLTTSDVSDLRATPIPFTADQPFIFFLRDKVENINIVTGIVNDPEEPRKL